jgi:hypothetical protein
MRSRAQVGRAGSAMPPCAWARLLVMAKICNQCSAGKQAALSLWHCFPVHQTQALVLSSSCI